MPESVEMSRARMRFIIFAEPITGAFALICAILGVGFFFTQEPF